MSVKNCVTCKHSDILEYKEPCASCENYQKWESLAPQWISVEDRLPDIDRRYGEWAFSEDMFVYAGSWIGVAFYCHKTERWIDSCNENVHIKVTHWMPLPEPPEED